jgi:hypothetical protein
MASTLLALPAMRSREVAIVSNNPETLDALQSYLLEAGVAARCTRDLAGCARFGRATTLAFVLFPDDFRWENVIAAIAALAEARPRALPLVVTAQPQRFRALAASQTVVVVPRPAWGWTILEAVRAHLDRAGADAR